MIPTATENALLIAHTASIFPAAARNFVATVAAFCDNVNCSVLTIAFCTYLLYPSNEAGTCF